MCLVLEVEVRWWESVSIYSCSQTEHNGDESLDHLLVALHVKPCPQYLCGSLLVCVCEGFDLRELLSFPKHTVTLRLNLVYCLVLWLEWNDFHIFCILAWILSSILFISLNIIQFNSKWSFSVVQGDWDDYLALCATHFSALHVCRGIIETKGRAIIKTAMWSEAHCLLTSPRWVSKTLIILLP